MYFVKVDVQACFDTIEQEKLLEILTHLITDVIPSTRLGRFTHYRVQDTYMLQKFGQINPTAGKMRKSFRRLACADGELSQF